MTIRFTCAGCGSLLKIKEELAGTDGKCPKCKTEFVVPNSMADEDSRELLVMPSEPAESHAKPEKKSERRTERPAVPAATNPVESIAEKPAKLASKQKKPGSSADFDPADFLMGDGERPSLPLSGYDIAADSDDDHPPRPAPVENRPKRPVAKPPSSGTIATAAGGGSGISASAHAKEMMMKAMEDSRLHAGDAPPDEAKDGFDYAGMFRELGLKGGLGLVAVILVSYGIYMFFDSMMGGRLALPPLGYVTGVVTLDGTPLPGATVYFAPLETEIPGTKKERARTSYGITDENGAYKMIYIGKTQGVAVGKCRVWLDLIGPKGQMIPPDYTEGVMQVRDVKTGSQDFPFNMSSAR